MPSISGDNEKSEVGIRKSEDGGPRYWRSLNELADKPSFQAFVEREFPAHASEWFGGSRRTFLKIMGASMALAGMTSCIRWPAEHLAPYAHRPVGRMDGVPVHYATAMEFGGMGIGVLAISVDGRPIKVDGNPTHPLSKGASDVFLQASVLNVYDPDRSRGVVSRSSDKREEKSWEDMAGLVSGMQKNGAGMVILAEASRSPSVAAMRKRFSQAQWFEYEAVGCDNQRAGARAVFGRPLRAVADLSKASVVVSIDADLFVGDPLSIKYNRDFMAGRQLKSAPKSGETTMNRLFVVESGFSITGSMADHRRGVQPSQIPAVLAAIVGDGGGVTNAPFDKELAAFIEVVKKEIAGAPGKAIVVAGNRQPAEVHAAVAAFNASIQAPVEYYADPEDPRADAGWTAHAEQIQAFAQAAPGAEVVLILGANPVLTAPADLDIAGILKKSKLVIHAGAYEDETAQAAHWHLPLAHYLEAWGDVRTFDGTVSIAQPLIEPIFGGKSTIEILALFSGREQPGMEIVRATAKADYLAGRFSEWAWKQSLFNGIVENTGRSAERVAAAPGAANTAYGKLAAGQAADYELFLTSGMAYDGRYANNGWLMELPDPMTRVTWDNPAIVSLNTAAKLGVDSDDVVRLTAGGKSVEVTIYVMPGHPDGAIGIAAGYGRQAIGMIANGTGSDAYPLFSTKDGSFAAVSVAKTGKVNHLSCVQDHHTIDKMGKQRLANIVPELVVEGTFLEYLKNPALDTQKVVSLSLWNEYDYDNEPGKPYLHKWGMAIDLTTCTACSACITACQAENNVPIVGKEQVGMGREMHWLRLDRYFKHDPNNPQAVHQPVMCMHCENAPCEEVCPVAATTHSVEGINMMTYNRCIGTRYCSNNCPYKVRRFNFFDYNSGTIKNLFVPNQLRADINELHKMQKNPQVTVRSRGVMEKCTYCVQRIENARIEVRAENRGNADNARIPEGRVVTACQQACPTDAIVFGDLNDKKSRVAQLHTLAQSYGLLDPELNTKPRTLYLAKVRNPNPELDEAMYEGRGEKRDVTFATPGERE